MGARSQAPVIWRVALPVAGADYFDYLPPTEGAGLSDPAGWAVEVPFGRRQLRGIVCGLSATTAVPAAKLRRVSQVLEAQPLFDPPALKLLQFAAQHYQHPLGLTMATAMPPGLLKADRGRVRHWRLSAEGRRAAEQNLARGARQQQVLRQLLTATEGLPRSELDVSAATLRSLQAHGWLEAATASSPEEATTATEPVALRPSQQACVETLGAAEGFCCHLLEGPTGSGKTEVYLAQAAVCLARRQQVLMLVPEIALTPQMVTRVRQRIRGRVGVLHSQMGTAERCRLWRAARQGELDMVLATRSGIFVPLPRLGLVVVDEEHDSSYKQQDGLRYSARDLAVYRARQQSCAVVLGSATPSLESLYNVQRGRYQRLRLDAAPRGRFDLRIVDMRNAAADEPVSAALRQACQQHLARGGQIFLFLNRRGFAPVLYCADCGWSAPCSRCDSAMVWHRDAGQLRCHHCDHRQPHPARCGGCGSPELIPVGWGTQRVMDALEKHFPGVPLLRFDRDSLRRRGALEEALDALHDNRARIVVGTQMLAKGHDFPHLSLVGVIDADSGLYSTDFRAAERFGQLLSQVSGRAGRRAQDAQCLIQTRNPTHPYLQTWLSQSYAGLVEVLLSERVAARWPPAAHLALLRVEAGQSAPLEAFFQQLNAMRFASQTLEVLGPVSRPRRAGRERRQLLFRAGTRSDLAHGLRSLRDALDNAAYARKVRWSIDVDPQNLD